MKKRLLIALVALGSLVAWTAKGDQDTLIQYNFDSKTDANSRSEFQDDSGNGRWLRFNRVAGLFDDYPFSISHPALTGLDKVARTNYAAATQGTVQDVTGINLAQNGHTFTMEGWVNLEQYSAATLWSLQSSSGGTSRFTLGIDSSGYVTGRFYSQGNGDRSFTTTYQVNLSEWVHIAYVKEAARVRIYVNGILIYTLQEEGVTSRALPTSLDNIYVALDIRGYFDDFRLTNRALTVQELGYYHPFTIPEPAAAGLILPGLVAGYLVRRRNRKK